MEKPTPSPATGAKQQIEKQARQLAYDTRYKVKQSMSAKSGARLDPAAVRKAYMSQLSKSSAAPAVKARAKQMLLGEDLINTKQLANESVSAVFSKVFSEKVETEVTGENNDEDLLQIEEVGEKTYKIRVTDKKTGNTYVRMASRSKIAELRANPNIASVEMTSYGEVSKSEKEKGSQTAAAKAGKDYDGDGKIESGAIEYRGAVHNAIQRKKGLKPDGKDTSNVKEEFIDEVKKDEDGDQKKNIGKNVNNYKNKSVKMFPEISEQAASSPTKSTDDSKNKQVDQANERTRQQEVQILQRKLQALRSAPRGSDPSIMASYEPEGENVQEVAPPGMEGTVKAMKKHPELSRGKTPEGKEKNIYALAWWMKNKGYKSHRKPSGAMKEAAECGCEDETEPKLKKSEGAVEDPRAIPTKMNLVKNKFRAMGLKMSYEPEGEVIDERRKEDKVTGTPRKPRDRAFEIVAKAMGSGRMGVQPRGKKKEPGKKPPAAGEYGGPHSPAQKVAARRAAAQRAQDMQSSRFD